MVKLYLRKLYWAIRAAVVYVLGTRAEEWRWAARSRKSVKRAFSNLNFPPRQFVISKLLEYGEIESLLEIGSGYGPNLYWLSRYFPCARFTGIDINRHCITEGNRFFKERGISNVRLIEAKADQLNFIPDKSEQIVLTYALLMSIGPEKIKTVLSHMCRIASRRLVLLERHYCDLPAEQSLGVWHDGCWKRNYLQAFDGIVPSEKITFVKIPRSLWDDKEWQEFGYIIEVMMDV